MNSSRPAAELDVTGSGAETIAHLRENGRIVFMFCEFNGTAKIVRRHGQGAVTLPGSERWNELIDHFPDQPGTRSIIAGKISRVSDSCGFGVPKYEYVKDRQGLAKWAQSKGPEGLAQYKIEKNSQSIDGLPGLDPAVLRTPSPGYAPRLASFKNRGGLVAYRTENEQPQPGGSSSYRVEVSHGL